MLKQLSGLFEPAKKHYSYEIQKGVNDLDEAVFIVQILLPGIGWVYLTRNDYIENNKAWAARYDSIEQAEAAAKQAVAFHQRLDKKNSITWE